MQQDLISITRVNLSEIKGLTSHFKPNVAALISDKKEILTRCFFSIHIPRNTPRSRNINFGPSTIGDAYVHGTFITALKASPK